MNNLDMNTIVTILSLIAAILAWVAKLRWSKEYSQAKNEIIRAKDAQINLLNQEISTLKEMTPMKIREYFNSVKQQLEEYNESLNQQLMKANGEIEKKNQLISELKNKREEKSEEISKLAKERDDIQKAAKNLEQQMQELRNKYQEEEKLYLKIPNINAQFLRQAEESFKQLRNALAHQPIADLQRQYKIIAESLNSLGGQITFESWRNQQQNKKDKENES